ncbi:hypothetical protein C8J56DRAFT_11653 [Mycena floridula]|nr:hypothetical protein C8J56DRAFT_11653 [Mycena floridula]
MYFNGVEQPIPPNERYQLNLKVLQRREPSITSFFHQFSHVCVYHHDGEKWEKQGFEGTMFLYERNSYPPYGFYILNRMGTTDYDQRLYPEDDIGVHGSYLMLRSYPDYTKARLRRIPPDTDIFSGRYMIPPNLTKEDKEIPGGQSVVIGLWVFAGWPAPADSLIDVMHRLHTYVRKNERYPDEFRMPVSLPSPQPTDLQALLASLNSPPQVRSTGEMSFEQLVDALQGKPDGGHKMYQHQVKEKPPPPEQHTTRPPSSSVLLDQLFAEAAASGSYLTAAPAKEEPQPIIHSPQPTSSALPQILNEEVIDNLMGFSSHRKSPAAKVASKIASTSSRRIAKSSGPSSITATVKRKSSNTSTANSSRSLHSRQSHPSSREGDNESESDSISDRDPVTVDDEEDSSCLVAGDDTPRAQIHQTFHSSSSGKSQHEPPLIASSDVWSSAPAAAPLFSASSWIEENFDEGDDEIVELDFSDTRALSMLGSSSKENGVKGKKGKGKAGPPSVVAAPVVVPPVAPPPEPPKQVEPPKQTEPLKQPPVSQSTAAVDPAIVTSSLISTIISVNGAPRPGIGKKEFMREVLTLIHTDPSFVERLWSEYSAQASS